MNAMETLEKKFLFSVTRVFVIASITLSFVALGFFTITVYSNYKESRVDIAVKPEQVMSEIQKQTKFPIPVEDSHADSEEQNVED